MVAARIAPAGWRGVLVDAGLAAIGLFVALAVIIDLAARSAVGTGRLLGASGFSLVAAAGLLIRRRRPAWGLGLVITAGCGYWLLAVAPVGLGLSVLFGVYAVSAHGTRPVAWGGLGAVLVFLTAHQLATWWVDGASFVGNVAMLGGAWLMGLSTKRRRSETDAHAARAASLELAQAELARQAVVAERLRIARELHDVVAHTMSVIAINAGTGRLAFDRDPDVARQAFVTIESSCRDALDQMRRLLGVLRADDGFGGDPGHGAERLPLPGLDDVTSLVDASRRGGIDVDLRLDGDHAAVPAPVGLTAYRIVQEALTNVARHARTRHATVTVTVGAAAVVLSVTNPPGPTTEPRRAGVIASTRSLPRHGPVSGFDRDAGAGVGLIGMRERAQACGGTVVAEHLPDGGFRVMASLPYTARPADRATPPGTERPDTIPSGSIPLRILPGGTVPSGLAGPMGTVPLRTGPGAARSGSSR